MKIKKLPELFEISFKKVKRQELLDFLKLCIKYRSRLFCEDFYKHNFSSPTKFLRFIKDMKDCIYCINIGKNSKIKAFIYLYDFKKAYQGTFDAKVTFCVEREYWGFGSFAIAKKGLKFLFEEIKIRKLSAEIIGENTLAKSLLNKLGFELEAVLIKECVEQGKAKNLYIYSKFNPAYEFCG